MIVGVKVINKSKNDLPVYKCEGDSGMDVRANLMHPITLLPGKRETIPTGLYFQLPKGYEFQVRPRSGLARDYGITVLNTPGTLDSGYTGELQVTLLNTGDMEFQINPGDRIAQIVLCKVPTVEWEQVTEFTRATDRGDGGFGHTGIK